MGQTADSTSVFGRFKEFLNDRFWFVEDYTKFIKGHDKPLTWSDSDVDKFIAIDPVHGPALKAAREATKFAAAGSLIGAVNLAGVAWKYSKSPHGTALSLAAGAVFGWTFGYEIGNHYYQLYRVDNMGAQEVFGMGGEQEMSIFLNPCTGSEMSNEARILKITAWCLLLVSQL